MLTKNGKAAIATCIAINDANISNNNVGFLPVRYTDGNTRYVYSNSNNWPTYKNYSTNIVLSTASTYGVVVGSGGTPATEDDYDLESQITSDISGAITRIGIDDLNNEKITIAFDIVISNASNNSITIREIGLKGRLATTTVKGANTGANASYAYLMDRTILPAPVTIEPNDYATIRYAIAAEV